MTSVQTVVVGAGAVGLSIARLLTRAGREVLLVDKAARVASGTSSRNSGVVHAGLYYDRGSLKAATCVEGSWMLHKFADMYKVPINRCGKLVVATDRTQDAKLQLVYTRATGLGARDIVLLTGEDARRFEPALPAHTAGAIWSPHTSVIDAVAFSEALLKDCTEEGKDRFVFAPHADVSDIAFNSTEQTFRLSFSDGSKVKCEELINAGGLYARDLAALIHRESEAGQMVPESKLPNISYHKGSYFALKQKALCPFERLIYPTRVSGHLGIHLTIDTAGAIRFGPNSEKLGVRALPRDLEASGLLAVDESLATEFRDAVSDYWPDAPEADAFEADYAGIRPKSEGNDFILDQHGIPGYVGLYGVDSPGLTAALSLAHRVGDMLGVHGVVTPEMKSSHTYEWEQ